MSESKPMSIEELEAMQNEGGIQLCLVKAQDGHDYLVCRDHGYRCVAVSMTHAAGCERCQSAQVTL